MKLSKVVRQIWKLQNCERIGQGRAGRIYEHKSEVVEYPNDIGILFFIGRVFFCSASSLRNSPTRHLTILKTQNSSINVYNLPQIRRYGDFRLGALPSSSLPN